MRVQIRAAIRPLYVMTAALLTAYFLWRLFPDLPYGDSAAATGFGVPLGLVAAFVAWRASRRCGDTAGLRRAWILIALGLAGQTAGAATEFVAELGGSELPYPSIADVFYLSFYPLMLVGVLSFPTLQRSRRQALELALDCAIVGIGGAAAFGYLVLGPQLLQGASALESLVTIAYPVGDMVLIVALAAAVMGGPLPGVRASLAWMTCAMGLFILGDLVWGYAVLHGNFEPSSLLNVAYQAAFACFIIAASVQRPVSGERPMSSPERAGRGSWLPYFAIALVITVLLSIDHGPLFPDFLVVMLTAVVFVLVVARQLVSLVDLRQNRARLAEAQELAQLGSWDWDIVRDRVLFSDEGARQLGIEPGSAPTFADAADVVLPEDRVELQRVVDEAVEHCRPYTIELRVRRNGEVRNFLSRADVEVKDGRAVRIHGTHQDVTDRRRMESQLEYQAEHDPLTGLFNRRRFAAELERALRFVRRYGRSGAVLMIDVDNFKLVNDTRGHAAGDAMLKGLAAAISGRARETDVVARLGGDELAVILPEASLAEAAQAAEDIRNRVAGSNDGPNLSIGIAPFDGDAELVADDVLVAADMALYEAKEAGKNQVCVYSGKTNGAMNWVERIRAALDEGRFILYAQPMIDIASGEVSHRELLIRMLSEQGEVIPPGAFLPTAERVGLITEIDRWVTGEGLRLAGEGERVSVNLSGASIGDAEILAMVTGAIEAGTDPGALIFEITETAAMTNMAAARDFVGALSDLGCGVALDDFGTGFGSFTYLKHLPTSHLKIDMEFVHDVLANATDREVVRSITDVAHSLGKQTVAEGVEDEATLAAMREYGVDCAQGLFVGPPERISPPTGIERGAAVTSRPGR